MDYIMIVPLKDYQRKQLKNFESFWMDGGKGVVLLFCSVRDTTREIHT
jgi:hypothetical protein